LSPFYFETHFSHSDEINHWPDQFAIITAYATTGEVWTDEQNTQADLKLAEKLGGLSDWLIRLTGYSPDTHHKEEGWAVCIDWDKACDIGLEFKQDAIYYVSKNTLTVSYCDERREHVQVGEFSERTHRTAD